jgi:hypothetical protein
MGSHIVNGQFQSDKYPTCPPGKVPLSVGDPDAQPLLYEYAITHVKRDAEFAHDLAACLEAKGYETPFHRPSSISPDFTACGLPLERFPINRNLRLGDGETCSRCTHVIAQVLHAITPIGGG